MTEEIMVQQSDRLLRINDTIADLKAFRTFVKNELKEGIDFGKIPGTNDKDVLLQPGAQKIAMYYNCRPEFRKVVTELGNGHLEVVIDTDLIHRSSGTIMAQGLGSCTSMEKKYRWRQGQRVCPACGKAALILENEKFLKRGEAQGWLCWKKRDGCGTKFLKDDPGITSQVTDKIENPDIYDERNTVLKMAKKRSMVDAAIALGCAADLFTQDLDDIYDIKVQIDKENPPPVPIVAKDVMEKAVTEFSASVLTDMQASMTNEGLIYSFLSMYQKSDFLPPPGERDEAATILEKKYQFENYGDYGGTMVVPPVPINTIAGMIFDYMARVAASEGRTGMNKLYYAGKPYMDFIGLSAAWQKYANDTVEALKRQALAEEGR